jgi:hypothetical protein
MSTKAKIFVALGVTAAFVVGMGAGAASGPADGSAAPSDAITITEPGATVTQGVAVHDGTPQSCLVALTAAESLTRDASDFATTASQYPNLIRRALMAGYNQDIAAVRAITADVESISAEVKTETASVGQHGAVFRSNAAKCRSGA